MKNILKNTAIVLMTLLSISPSYGQITPIKNRNVILINMTDFLIGNVQATYEHKLKSTRAIALSAKYPMLNVIPHKSATVELKQYLSPSATKIYAAINTSIHNLDTENTLFFNDGEGEAINFLAVGILIGYQYESKDFTLDLACGFNRYSFGEESENKDLIGLPLVRLNVGRSF